MEAARTKVADFRNNRAQPRPLAIGWCVVLAGFVSAAFVAASSIEPEASDRPSILPVIDASDRRFTHVSLGQMPTRAVHGIIQGPHGFMWFAVQNKLLRFDGYEAKEYPRTANLNSRISFTRSMAVGHSGKLWLARDGGVGSLDRSVRSTNSIRLQKPSDPIRLKTVRSEDRLFMSSKIAAGWCGFPQIRGCSE